MKLDVVVPTYNRSELLRRTLASLLRAHVPDGLEPSIIVVDNNCSDDTRQVVEEMQSSAILPILYLKETKAGSSSARNAGIRFGKGELIGFIDDDEEVDEHWYSVVLREFTDTSTNFIGGPYLPNCAIPMPAWLPPGYNGVIGVIAPRSRTTFSPSFPGNLQGGNAVIRRRVFGDIGTYSTKLGRTGKGLLSEEDAEFYRRLLRAGIRGFHVPDLIIYHYISASRLTRSYHRHWCFWRGISQGIADMEHRESVRYLLGVPRYRFASAFRGLNALLAYVTLRRGSAQSFAEELALWDLLGFIRGKYFTRIDRLYETESPTLRT